MDIVIDYFNNYNYPYDNFFLRSEFREESEQDQSIACGEFSIQILACCPSLQAEGPLSRELYGNIHPRLTLI